MSCLCGTWWYYGSKSYASGFKEDFFFTCVIGFGNQVCGNDCVLYFKKELLRPKRRRKIANQTASLRPRRPEAGLWSTSSERPLIINTRKILTRNCEVPRSYSRYIVLQVCPKSIRKGSKKLVIVRPITPSF
jgi:hypothetical protein